MSSIAIAFDGGCASGTHDDELDLTAVARRCGLVLTGPPIVCETCRSGDVGVTARGTGLFRHGGLRTEARGTQLRMGARGAQIQIVHSKLVYHADCTVCKCRALIFTCRWARRRGLSDTGVKASDEWVYRETIILLPHS